MNNIGIGIKLITGFLVVATLTVLLGLVGYRGLSHTAGSLETMASVSLPSIRELCEIRFNIRNAVLAQRTLLLPGLSADERQQLYEDIETARAAYRRSMDAYETIPKTAEEARAWNAFKENLAAVVDINNQGMALIKQWAESEDAALHVKASDFILHQTGGRFVKIFAALNEVVQLNAGNATQQKDQALAAVNSDRILALTVMIIAPLLAVVLGAVLTISITRPLGRVVQFAEAVAGGALSGSSGVAQRDEIGRLAGCIDSMVAALVDKIGEANAKSALAEEETHKAHLAQEQAEAARLAAERAKREGMLQAATTLEDVVEIVSSASEELSAQIEQASQGAEIQAARMGDTAAAMEQMNATVLEVASNAGRAAKRADAARAKAQEGANLVLEVVSQIALVAQQTLNLKEDMRILGEQAANIDQIMDMISDIADQTNLLALNAAIEAARAGDAGRGFAVVADEVRKLAEKTMSATKQVGTSIDGIQAGTRKNVEGVDATVVAIERTTSMAKESGQHLTDIVALVDDTAHQIEGIAAASEEQSAASDEISRTVTEVNSISLETSQAMRESNQAVLELARQSQTVKRLIQDMQRG